MATNRQTTVISQRVRTLENRLRDHMTLYGYEEADAPILERADLFLTRAGDQILHKLFTFDRHSVQLSLRPEFTTPALHRYLRQYDADARAVARWQFSGVIFEDDPASDRLDYERRSIGAELIGMGGPTADWEIVLMAESAVQKLGAPNIRLIVGDVQLTRRLLASFDLDPRTQRFLMRNLDALRDSARGKAYLAELYEAQLMTSSISDEQSQAAAGHEEIQGMLNALLRATERGMTMGGRSQEDIARRLLRKYHRAAQRDQLQRALDVLMDWVQMQGAPDVVLREVDRLFLAQLQDDGRGITGSLETLFGYLGTSNASSAVEFVPGLVRNWDYYTGLVFELYADAVHIAGGGRYDDLARLLGAAQDIPAVGLVYYVDALLDVVPLPAESEKRIRLLVPSDTANIAAGHQWAATLRAHQLPVELLPQDAPLLASSGPELVWLRDSHSSAGIGRVLYRSREYTTEERDLIVLADLLRRELQ